MAAHFIYSVQKIPVPIEEAWSFFSTPTNLSAITPDNMGFHIISGDHNVTLFAGQVFEYKVSPLLRVPLYWKTEITRVEAPFCFIDEQRKGPYKRWEHRHDFRIIEGGVEMTDSVTYELPLGWLGNIANRLIVQKRLLQIFQFRYQRVEALLGHWPGQQPEISIK